MYSDNRIMTIGEKYFASTGRKFQFNFDEREARDERIAELAEAYEKQGDFYDAVGSIDSEEKLNLLWQARNRRDFHAMCRLMDEIMAEASQDYAEVKVLAEEEEAEERKALARPFRNCGRHVPAGFDD